MSAVGPPLPPPAILAAAALMALAGAAASVLIAPAEGAQPSGQAVPRPHLHVALLQLPLGSPANGASALGELLAFAEQNTAARARGASYVYASGVSRWRPRQIVRPQTWGIPRLLSLSPTWLTWSEDHGPGGAWRIYALKRRTRRLYLVDSSAREGPDLSQLALSESSDLHGDRLAWSYFICHPSCSTSKGIRFTSVAAWKDLPSGRTHVAARTRYPCASMFPSVWGNVLVWHQEGRCSGHDGTDVLMRNLESGKTVQLTHDHQSSQPVTNGRYVAWIHSASRFYPGSVVLLDLRTGRRSTVSWTCPGPVGSVCPHRHVGRQASPVVIGDRLLEWQYSLGAAIVAYDLQTGREYLVARGTHSRNLATVVSVPMATSGNRVVWDRGSFLPNGGTWCPGHVKAGFGGRCPDELATTTVP